jgi:hypothetical protein
LHSGQPFLLSREAIIIVLFCFISCTTAWRLVLVFFLFFFFAFFFPLCSPILSPSLSLASLLLCHCIECNACSTHNTHRAAPGLAGWWMAMHLSCRGHGLRLRGVMRHDVARRDMPGGFCMYGILWRRGGQDFNSMFVCATSCARAMLFLCCLTCMALASVCSEE